MARWETGVNGLDWLNEVAKTGGAENLGGNGYPLHYALRRVCWPRSSDMVFRLTIVRWLLGTTTCSLLVTTNP